MNIEVATDYLCAGCNKPLGRLAVIVLGELCNSCVRARHAQVTGKGKCKHKVLLADGKTCRRCLARVAGA